MARHNFTLYISALINLAPLANITYIKFQATLHVLLASFELLSFTRRRLLSDSRKLVL